MSAVILTELVHEMVPTLNIYEPFRGKIWAYLFWILLGIIGYFLISGFRSIQGNWWRRNKYELMVASILLLVIGMALVGPFHRIIGWAIQEPWHDLQEKIRDFSTVTSWVIGAGLTIIVVTVIKASENLSALASKLALFAAGVLGPALIFIVYLLLVVAQVDSPIITFKKPLAESYNSKTEKLTLDSIQLSAFKDKDIFYIPDVEPIPQSGRFFDRVP